MACKKLKSLSIENFDSLIYDMQPLNNLKLEIFTLEKLSIKIRNKRDLIYKLNMEEAKFPRLKKLTFFTSETNMASMPQELLYNLETLKIGATMCHSYTFVLHLRQLEFCIALHKYV